MCRSRFPKQKSDLQEIALDFVKELEQEEGAKVAFIRIDNSGENRALEAACKQEGLGIKFEFTAPNTPEQNWRIERKFATLLWANARHDECHAKAKARHQHFVDRSS